MKTTKKYRIKNLSNIHKERIECPECGLVQKAIVYHTIPWYTYIHQCIKCEYIIMENEWDKI
jgi:hypothetical protein